MGIMIPIANQVASEESSGWDVDDEVVGKACPECGAELGLGARNGLPAWECPSGHGVGVFLVDAYGKLQIDEIDAIRVGLAEAPASALASPITGEPMLEVTFIVDEDTRFGNEGAGARPMTIEVDPVHHFAWFSLAELRSMPRDPGRGPAGPGLVGMDQMQDAGARRESVFRDLGHEDYPMRGDSRLGGMFRTLADRLRS